MRHTAQSVSVPAGQQKKKKMLKIFLLADMKISNHIEMEITGMSAKKKILLLATGGTIASKKSENGLKPQITPEELLEYIPQIKKNFVRYLQYSF